MTDLDRSLYTDDGVASTLIRSENVCEHVELDQRTFSDESSEIDESSTFEVVGSGGSCERDAVCRRNRDGGGEGESRSDDGCESRKAKHGELRGQAFWGI